MNSRAEIKEDDQLATFTLPPYICNNTREMIGAEKIIINDIRIKQNVKENPKVQILDYPLSKQDLPSPLHPLTITWSPDTLSIVLSDEEILQRLWIWNSCYRTIYVHVCGFWDEKIRLGATWRCYPRTRFQLAPGMKGEIRIRATPHIQSPVACAYAGLQLASAHMRDHVTGYFLVLMQVKFLNYIPPSFGECE
ncbi:hypothetical protein K1T71_005119 [Dendrolimus kikuchii]|uniref:Uncharacterized protein n=1 Tax=Dendrolimus kikuchii TaxID=765133 RepID=A0ACC1D7M1_9NEOP|nr:hypothetical protein K1T71_005119 [Dendrolimus kikuchii]